MGSISSINRNSQIPKIIDGSKSKRNFKNSFFEKIDLHSTKIGYFPIAGTFTGPRRIYKTLTGTKDKWEIIRGSLETFCLGPLLAIIDAVVHSVKIISEHLKDKKKKNQKIIQLKNPSIPIKTPPDKDAVTNHAQRSPTTSKPTSLVISPKNDEGIEEVPSEPIQNLINIQGSEIPQNIFSDSLSLEKDPQESTADSFEVIPDPSQEEEKLLEEPQPTSIQNSASEAAHCINEADSPEEDKKPSSPRTPPLPPRKSTAPPSPGDNAFPHIDTNPPSEESSQDEENKVYDPEEQNTNDLLSNSLKSSESESTEESSEGSSKNSTHSSSVESNESD